MASAGTERTVESNDSMLKGLLKKPVAPALRARRFMASSAWPEMKIIGMFWPVSARCCCRSTPLMPGKFMSSMRQAESANVPEARNSSADPKETTSNPAAVITRNNIRDIDWSSSTMEIKVFLGDTLFLLKTF